MTKRTTPPHATLLFTWKPELYPISKLEETVRGLRERGEALVVGWSTGVKKGNVAVGDRVFLMRQGREPRGLVGAGWVRTEPEELPHWQKAKREKKGTYHQVQVLWDDLRSEPLLPLPSLLDRFGRASLWSSQGGGRSIPAELVPELEAAWQEALAPRQAQTPSPPDAPVAPIPWVDSDAVPEIGGLTDYRPSEHDRLDAKLQAKIFASLLVAKEVRPPFALGLLGDWGVGKTFFMRLMQENVAAVSGKGAPIQAGSTSVQRAAQIEFNAWHYVDSDLWASLASHIFDRLSEELRGPREKSDEVRRRLRREVHSSQKERKQAQAAIDLARKEHQEAANALADCKAKREAKRARVAAANASRVWKAVLRVRPNPEKPDQKDWPDLADLKRRAEEKARTLGIAKAIDGVEEAERVFRELRRLRRRGAGLTTALAASFTGGRVWLSGAVLLLLLVLVVAWPRMLQWIGVVENSTVEQVLAPVLRLATAVGAAAAWAGQHVRSISSAMAYLEKIREEIRRPRLPPDPPSREEEDLRREQGKLDAEIAEQEHRVEEADRQIAAAQAEIQRINAGGLVYDFLEGKVRDSRYLDRLGLISVIRNDFERLGGLLLDWRTHRRSSDVGEDEDDPVASDPVDRDPAEEDPVADLPDDPRPIERIILYIDDLDRCPPMRVVEVLQAVHLILAFDLFIVVVAVDARWLERSLNEAYNPATKDRDGSPQEPVHRFSAHNYLEKIFQIPFSLPAMSEPGYRKLVADMMKKPEPWKPETQESESPALVGNAAEVESVAPDVEDGGRSGEPGGGGEAAEPEQQEKQESEDKERRQKEQNEAELRIAALALRPWEEHFIAAFYPFIRTPRLAKRFVNVYRLLRVRAFEMEGDFSVFIDRGAGEYRAVLMLLALCAGRAEVAPEILEKLHAAEDDSFLQWIVLVCSAPKEGPAELSDAAARALQDAKTVTLELSAAAVKDAEKALPSPDDRLESYRKWAREVGRFSFRWHLRDDTGSTRTG